MPPRPRSPNSPKIKRNPCVQRIRAAAKAGDISDVQANKLIQDILNRAEHDRSRHFGDLQKSLETIAGEMLMTEKTNALIAKRNMLLSYKMTTQMVSYAKNAQFKLAATGMEKYMELTDIAGKDIGQRFWRRLISQWEADGVLDDALHNFPEQDFFLETWNISEGLGRATTNDKAFKIAQGFWTIKDESISMKNMLGATINRAPGHVLIQTHSPVKLRAAGDKGFFGWREKPLSEGFKFWRDWIDNNTRIDWKRTLDGGDKDKFLNEVFHALAMDMHTKDLDSIHEVTAFKTHGSLANKMSSGRVLWFADAKSAFAYHQMWGKRNVLEEIFAEIMQSGRHIAILQRMGPNPESALKNAKSKLLHDIEVGRKPDWQKQKLALSKDTLDNMWFELSGASQVTVRPRLSRFVDNVKALTLASHSGRMLFPSLGGDQAMMLSGAMYQGVTAMDFWRMRLATLKPVSPERLTALNQTSFVAHSYMGNIVKQWIHDIRPALFMEKITNGSMKLNLMNWWTSINERTATEIGSMIMGTNAAKSWDTLDPKYRDLLEMYSMDKAAWDAVRTKAYEVKDYGGAKVVTEELGEKLTDPEVDAILSARGLSVSPGNRARTRLSVATSIGTYVQDFMHFSTGRPTLRMRSMKSHGALRGHIAREASELFWIFKSFPMMAMFRAMENIQKHYVPKNGLSMGDWFKANNGFMWWASSYVAMTYMAGTVAQTLGDLASGRNPMPMFDKETGMPHWKAVVRHLARGGGAGILGDLLFSEYDRNTRDFFDVIAGPALGQLTNVTRLYTMGAKGLIGDDKAQERLGYYSLGFMERNLPFLNLFYIRPIYDQMIGWQLKEALSPGVLRRMERSIAEDNNQQYWLRPSNVQQFQPAEFSRKISAMFGAMDDIDLSLGGTLD